MARRIEYAPLETIREAELNPKRHDQAALRASMDRFGYLEPIVRDERTGRLVSGHGRLRHLRELRASGAAPPEGVREEAGDWLVPIVAGWSSRDDDEARALLVAVNRLTEAGGWDTRALLDVIDARLMGDLSQLRGTGIDLSDLDDLAALLEEETPPGPEPGPSMAIDRYRERSVRSIVLDFPTDTFTRVVHLAAEARAARHLASNAALFVALLEEDEAHG